MTVALKRCEPCGGTGTVPRVRRTLADGAPDPLDFRVSETCSRCGGGGSVPDDAYKQPDRAVKTGGWLADQITIEKGGP